MGIFYSEPSLSSEFMEQFFYDWYNASPAKTKNASSDVFNAFSEPEKLLKDYMAMSDIQKDFYGRIISECEKSTSLEDMKRRLGVVNEDIYNQVPEIQQERLFVISASLYYLSVEVERLRSNGQMFVGSVWNIPAIKTRSESGSFGDNCRSFYSSVAIAVGSIINSGFGREIVRSVVKVAGAAAGWIIVACSLVSGDTSNREYCVKKYEDCMQYNHEWAIRGSGKGNNTMCYGCFEYCRGQGVWDCPRPR